MRVLLDTHALIWWWTSPGRLTHEVLQVIRRPDSDVFVSAASAWEVATKCRIGKLELDAVTIGEWSKRLSIDRFRELPISSRHALRAGSLAGEHRDPFDRIIAAQGIEENLPVVTVDPQIAGLGAATIW
jgi:PIN domain nuclease of toxin-antitoxin system